MIFEIERITYISSVGYILDGILIKGKVYPGLECQIKKSLELIEIHSVAIKKGNRKNFYSLLINHSLNNFKQLEGETLVS